MKDVRTKAMFYIPSRSQITQPFHASRRRERKKILIQATTQETKAGKQKKPRYRQPNPARNQKRKTRKNKAPSPQQSEQTSIPSDTPYMPDLVPRPVRDTLPALPSAGDIDHDHGLTVPRPMPKLMAIIAPVRGGVTRPLHNNEPLPTRKLPLPTGPQTGATMSKPLLDSAACPVLEQPQIRNPPLIATITLAHHPSRLLVDPPLARNPALNLGAHLAIPLARRVRALPLSLPLAGLEQDLSPYLLARRREELGNRCGGRGRVHLLRRRG
ncbi:hypothetical protein BZA05DRAFT_387765 [Tricharina praecox]|uniref:uncharacterized protein n=1 Tax=Tricharina praecox TaxID=43433 RepID=UPI00221E3EFD|nr:uncharacterized protein BZA05DRAFT_387765 [Tricharina praecox]KAI5857271.1 hypothetical protein BZA05DRAFT_387765 [Tricharina praecox]